jgi:WD40 repeat protein
MKVWDTRSSLPLHTVANRHGDKKILCVDWSHPNEILTGGADNKTTCHVIPGSDRMVMNDICDM